MIHCVSILRNSKELITLTIHFYQKNIKTGSGRGSTPNQNKTIIENGD